MDNDGHFSTYMINSNKRLSYISEDVSDHFADGWTVTFEAIQLEIYMGFTKMYLLGVDFDYSVMVDADRVRHIDNSKQDYFDGRKYADVLFNYNNMLHAYVITKKYCDNHGLILKNATRGGKLEVFERVDLDDIVGGYFCHIIPGDSLLLVSPRTESEAA